MHFFFFFFFRQSHKTKKKRRGTLPMQKSKRSIVVFVKASMSWLKISHTKAQTIAEMSPLLFLPPRRRRSRRLSLSRNFQNRSYSFKRRFFLVVVDSDVRFIGKNLAKCAPESLLFFLILCLSVAYPKWHCSFLPFSPFKTLPLSFSDDDDDRS